MFNKDVCIRISKFEEIKLKRMKEQSEKFRSKKARNQETVTTAYKTKSTQKHTHPKTTQIK